MNNSMIMPLTVIRNRLRRSPLRRMVMSYRHRGIGDADVLLASYPRSGNTWLKSLIASCLLGEPLQNLSDTVNPVIPMVGYHRGTRPLLKNSGRVIKTHEGYRPEYKRAIWVVRDPRDVVMSEYKLEVRSNRCFGTFDEFLQDFIHQRAGGRATWQTHTQSWLDSALHQSGNVLFIAFEQLRAEPGEQLQRVLRFLDAPFDQSSIAKALEQNSIQMLAERHAAYDRTLGSAIRAEIPAVNRGLSGGWRDQLPPAAVQSIEQQFGDVMERVGYRRSKI